MNSGSGPDWDDFGLPPIDVQIPDDARELDRDMQAYHRELRALRRRRRLRHLAWPLARHGVIMPLIAGCLALTLLAGTLLTLFTAGQAAWAPVRAARPGGTSSRTGRAGQPLPAASLLVGGLETPLTALTASVLAIVPPRCGCEPALRRLAGQVRAARGNIFVVGVSGAQVAGLTRQLGLPATRAAEDPQNVLVSSYHLHGPTAIVVRPDGLVAAVIPARAGRFPLGRSLQSVAGGSPQQQG